MTILSNHFHLILRSRPDEFELKSIRNDPEKVTTIRTRLSDVAWWMRLLCLCRSQPIFERLKLDVRYWKLLVKDFGRLFSLVAGAPTNVYEMRNLISKRRFNLKRLDRQLAATS